MSLEIAMEDREPETEDPNVTPDDPLYWYRRGVDDERGRVTALFLLLEAHGGPLGILTAAVRSGASGEAFSARLRRAEKRVLTQPATLPQSDCAVVPLRIALPDAPGSTESDEEGGT